MSAVENTAKTGVLFVVILALFGAVGFILGGLFQNDPFSGMVVFLVFAGLMNAVALFWGDKLILRAYRAKQVSEQEAPRLHRMVARLAQQAGLPKPKVYLIQSATPNAFATGRSPKHGKVAFTTGIVELLGEDELEGVAAHELAHIKHRDMLIMTIAATLAAAIGFAVRMAMYRALFGRDARENLPILILLAVTAPLAAMLVQMAISRTREFRADAGGASFTGNPRALAAALKKLETGVKANPMEKGNPAHASLFIVNPFRGGAFVRMFSTHPPMGERIRRLEALA